MRDAAIYNWIKLQEASGSFYQEVDGYWVWSPDGITGFVNEHTLTKLAEYLKAKNAAWDWQINNDPAIGGPYA